MNHRTRSFIVIVFLLLGGAALAQDAERTQEVLTKLNETPTRQSVFDYVGFQLSGEIVVLSGFTIQPGLKAETEKLIRSLEWVAHVVNRIEVLPVEATGSLIRGRSEAVLKKTVPYAFPENRADIRIKVKESHVTLVGSVAKIHTRRLENAVSEIKGLPSVKSVTNDVKILDN